MKSRIVSSYALVLLFVFAMLLVWTTGLSLGLQDAGLSPRYRMNAIPIVVSVLLGKDMDYAAYSDVSFKFTSEVLPPGGINALISQILAHPPNTSPDRLWLISGDDKGLVDLTYWAFMAFGSRQQSIYYLIFLLFVFSCVLYIIDSLRSPERLAVGVAVILALYALLFTFQITDQSSSLTEPRFLGFLSILATLQLLMTIQEGSKLTPIRVAVLVLQAALLGIVVRARSSETWQVISILGLYALTLAWFVVRRLRAHQILLRRGDLAPLVSRGVVVALPLVAVLGFGWYAQRMSNPVYEQRDTHSHSVWHNALMALGVDQKLAEKYHLEPLNDVKATRAVDAYLVETGDTALREAIFHDPNYNDGNFANFDWKDYENAAERYFWHILSNDWPDVVFVYALWMPETFAENVLFMVNAGTVFPGRLYPVGEFAQIPERNTTDAYLKPFRPMAVLGLVIGSVLLAFAQRPGQTRRSLWVLLWAAAFSLLPPLLAVPALMYTQLSLLLLTAVGYYGLMVVGGYLVRAAVDWLPTPVSRRRWPLRAS